MLTVHFINLDYIFVRLFEIVSSFSGYASAAPSVALTLVELVAIVGSLLSLLFLVLIVYVRISTVQVEHHGFHVKEERELAIRQLRDKNMSPESQPKNARWEVVAELASSSNDSDWRRAILEADILLQALLTDRGYTGDTLSEQLKRAQFTTIDLAWEAHRMRNAIAHLGEAFPLTERDVRATVDLYRRVFEEFDYI